MQIDYKHVIKSIVMLSVLAAGGKAKADLVTALDSSFALTARAQAGPIAITTDTAAQSQGPTTNPLSVSVQADSTYSLFDASVLATGNGSASWLTAAQGQVMFTDIGWTAARATGLADLSSNTGWTYSFTSNVTGDFVISYGVTAEGTSSAGPPTLAGLNGFYIYGGPGLTPPNDAILLTGLNTTGAVALPITAGDVYTVEIQSDANLYGGVGTRNMQMNGDFNFTVQTSVPEPSSLVMCLIVLPVMGGVVCLKSAGSEDSTIP